MKIVQTYSHLNGLEFLMVHHSGLLDEIKAAIFSIDAEAHRTKVSKEKKFKGKKLYSPVDLNKSFKTILKQSGWEDSRVSYWVTENADLNRRTVHLLPDEQKLEIESAGATALHTYNQTDFVKERVAVEIQFGKYSFVAYDLFVKHMAFYVGNEIDVGIEILPMKSMTSEMSSGIGYYENEIYNVIRQGRGVPAVPLVVFGIAP